ncbi:AAA family ATPase [Prochlorococcus marinus]|uniref:AAA family ATPase n=1 Tax=Prochlorococcus marinus TaxID=1219 RepID=UPI001ADC3FB3|nr:AAA family ATPase [Prochlorococcus marinus]MBO8218193.1 DNA recombination protein RecN [Prochlorococcus marinus XMU1405]MBW3039529.1 DNA recombination protein RecN [Prochlorococcus marinus str. MU1405]MBW3046985.1 DNA recombination protein RecN [Prochlorococcus marinus str. MU1406]
MLVQLKIENIALIEIIEINFEKGLNIITGDSGSGKSLILDSLNALFGGTNIPLKHLIRLGKDFCVIEAIFTSSFQINNWLISNGFETTSSEIQIKRKSYKKNNKILSKYSVNDLPITRQSLEKLGGFLVDFAGQSSTFIFDSLDNRRLIIDDLCSKKFRDTSERIKSIWGETKVLKGLMDEKIEFSRNQEEKNLAIKHMLKSLEEADLSSSEEILELELLENKLVNNLQINNSIKSSLENLNNFSHDEPSVTSFINQSLKILNKTADFDLKIQKFREKLLNIHADVEDLIFDLKSYLQEIENYESKLPDIQKRLFFLKNLERTFSLDLTQLIEKRDQLKTYFQQNDQGNEICSIKAQIENLQSNLNSLFVIQSTERKKTAKQLQNSVMSILRNLGLENANFSIQFTERKPSGDGIDDINFLFSANPDQKLAPLSNVISGGEMSRFLLAIKSSISKQPNTFFLDEIDSGLSGKSLFSLVELIKEISKNQQVLCITHQPFLAARGSAHFKVNKKVINGITYTSIAKLTTKNQRKNELIELIGGGSREVNEYASRLLDRLAA